MPWHGPKFQLTSRISIIIRSPQPSPTSRSNTLWLLEFLPTLASGGNERRKSYVYLALCLVLWPIKFFDAPFVGRQSFLAMAPTILTAVRKP